VTDAKDQQNPMRKKRKEKSCPKIKDTQTPPPHCNDIEEKNQKSSKGSQGIEMGIAKYVKVGLIMSGVT